MALDKPTYDIDNIQGLATLVQDQETALKVLFDKAGADAKAYLISLCDQLDLDFATKVDLVNAILGEFPDGSIDDVKLSNTVGQIKERVATHITSTANPHAVTATQTGAIPTTQKGVANGVASLASDGKVPLAQLTPATTSGSYAGNNTNPRQITVGYQPKMVFLTSLGSTNNGSVGTTAYYDGTGSVVGDASTGGTTVTGGLQEDFIVKINSTGFLTGLNATGTNYGWVAIR